LFERGICERRELNSSDKHTDLLSLFLHGIIFNELGNKFIGEKISIVVIGITQRPATLGKLAGFTLHIFNLHSFRPFPPDGIYHRQPLEISLLYLSYVTGLEYRHNLVDVQFNLTRRLGSIARQQLFDDYAPAWIL